MTYLRRSSRHDARPQLEARRPDRGSAERGLGRGARTDGVGSASSRRARDERGGDIDDELRRSAGRHRGVAATPAGRALVPVGSRAAGTSSHARTSGCCEPIGSSVARSPGALELLRTLASGFLEKRRGCRPSTSEQVARMVATQSSARRRRPDTIDSSEHEPARCRRDRGQAVEATRRDGGALRALNRARALGAEARSTPRRSSSSRTSATRSREPRICRAITSRWISLVPS